MDDIGGRIRETRKSARLSQVDFATSLAITQSFLSAVETGKNQPTAELLTRLANIYNTDINWLLTGKGKGLTQRAAEGIYDKAGPPKGLAQRIAEDGLGADSSMPWNDFHLGMGDSMELLVNIHKSGNKVLIRAINANLMAFNEAIENKGRAEITINAITEMRAQMKAMDGKISILEKENYDLRQKILSRDEREPGEAVG